MTRGHDMHVEISCCCVLWGERFLSPRTVLFALCVRKMNFAVRARSDKRPTRCTNCRGSIDAGTPATSPHGCSRQENRRRRPLLSFVQRPPHRHSTKLLLVKAALLRSLIPDPQKASTRLQHHAPGWVSHSRPERLSGEVC